MGTRVEDVHFEVWGWICEPRASEAGETELNAGVPEGDFLSPHHEEGAQDYRRGGR